MVKPSNFCTFRILRGGLCRYLVYYRHYHHPPLLLVGRFGTSAFEVGWVPLETACVVFFWYPDVFFGPISQSYLFPAVSAAPNVEPSLVSLGCSNGWAVAQAFKAKDFTAEEEATWGSSCRSPKLYQQRAVTAAMAIDIPCALRTDLVGCGSNPWSLGCSPTVASSIQSFLVTMIWSSPIHTLASCNLWSRKMHRCNSHNETLVQDSAKAHDCEMQQLLVRYPRAIASPSYVKLLN